MALDATTLRDFYRSPLGRVARRQLTLAIREKWKRVNGLTVAGAGFASPFLGTFRTEAASLACLMPSRQGAVIWPRSGHCHSVLVGETQWPLPDNSIDRLLMVHCLEQSERPGPLLREVWRVLKPAGSVLFVVPNRRGLWSRMDRTPFGYGLPFSRGQLETQLTDALFTPIAWGECLYFPPVSQRLMLRMAPAFERFGSSMSMGVAGVILVEATKEVMAPVGSGKRALQPAILKPAADVRSPTAGVRALSGRG
ncbi:class I SAM-dependent methyltransferase [Hyphomicrobium sp.]|uniref:methyltransferase domain-containing protein n=1 Tax=Hyphomicrobium sp. TaxID=82 RepID=UPI000FA4A1AF|nr:class I SAM-dependent methyltransferase [Hyphomicrobium sp.]RUO97229.1 MAG: class I SAM-dependent methyltransferase [Hyphomicrobium sp.]